MIKREIDRAMANLVAPDKNLSDAVDARFPILPNQSSPPYAPASLCLVPGLAGVVIQAILREKANVGLRLQCVYS